MNDASTSRPWLEHLTDGDVARLSRVAPSVAVDAATLRDRATLAAVLAHPATYQAIFGGRDDEAFLHASPFLVFATAVHRGWADLQSVRHVDEWVGVRRRLPVLGGDDLRTFLSSDPRRLFLTELLASYTRVASGSTWVRTARGWQRRRFSELDPVRLAALLEVVPAEERPGVYRRLGDLALFMTGVFPDHTAEQGFGPIDEARLLRTMGAPPVAAAAGVEPPSAIGSVGLLERLGERWYRLACSSVDRPLTGSMTVVAEVAERFDVARRALNFLTDRYLFPIRDRWLRDPAA